MIGQRLADHRWPEVPTGVTVLVPVGSLEQHGPHLPLDTDTVIAVAVAERVAERLTTVATPVLVAPAVAIGASGEHQDFPGTLSIGHEALHDVLVELGRSANTWARRVVFVNGHGGNVATLRTATAQLRTEGRAAEWVPCPFGPGADAHAGSAETALLLHLAPARVDLPRAEPGRIEPLATLLPELIAAGVRRISPNGVLGDPSGATAAQGVALLERMVGELVNRLSPRRPPIDTECNI